MTERTALAKRAADLAGLCDPECHGRCKECPQMWVADALAELDRPIACDDVIEECAKLVESVRPDGGMAWSETQHACYNALSYAAEGIRAHKAASSPAPRSDAELLDDSFAFRDWSDSQNDDFWENTPSEGIARAGWLAALKRVSDVPARQSAPSNSLHIHATEIIGIVGQPRYERKLPCQQCDWGHKGK